MNNIQQIRVSNVSTFDILARELFVVRGALCFVSTGLPPLDDGCTPPPAVTTKMFSDIAKCPVEAQISTPQLHHALPTKNHGSRSVVGSPIGMSRLATIGHMQMSPGQRTLGV